MGTRVALLRGVNVGGRHRLPMAEVRQVLDGAGLGPVRAHIQSGNIVLHDDGDEAGTARHVQELLERHAGFPVPTVVLDADGFRAVADQCPFTPELPKLAHVVVLPDPLDEERRERLLAMAADDQSSSGLAVGVRAVYLHHPDGLLSSRLAASAMRLLPDGTARNLGTVAAITRMLP